MPPPFEWWSRQTGPPNYPSPPVIAVVRISVSVVLNEDESPPLPGGRKALLSCEITLIIRAHEYKHATTAERAHPEKRRRGVGGNRTKKKKIIKMIIK